jgi:hypothetical protein
MFCELYKMARHPVYKARIQGLVEEFREATDLKEWANWRKKYSLWDAESLTTSGIREDGQHIWVLHGHPVLDLLRCNVGLLPHEPDGVWNRVDRSLFESGCQMLRLRFDFLRPIQCMVH